MTRFMVVTAWLLIGAVSVPGAAAAAGTPSAAAVELAPAAVALDSIPGGSLSLADAVARAAGAAPGVQIAALRIREAQARSGQALSALLPTLSGAAFNMQRTFNFNTLGISFPAIPGFPTFPTIIGPVYQFDARFRGSQTLIDPASYVRLRSAKLAVGVSLAEQNGSAETAAQSAALAYVRAARAAAQITARAADLGLARELRSLAEDQLRAGTAAEIDVIRARTQEAAARGALLVARNQADRAAIDLARALGIDPAMRFTLTDTLAAALGGSQAPPEPEAAVKLALERRPELVAERGRLQRARTDRLAIHAERLPRLDVSGDWGASGVHVRDAVPTRDLEIALSMPIFDGLRREDRVAEQNAIAREAEVRVRDLERQVAADVRGAALDVSSGLELESVAMERLDLAQQELDQARVRFTSGVAGNIDVIDAQSNLIRARDAVIDARTAVVSARIALARAAGVARTVQ
ncbi:MAG TPA: TolC family protein [Terriglobales bacterium]|nr:TolC family protein [Terriglobales bacterium]